MPEINFNDFKCRCSAITMMMAESQSNAPLTENQFKRKEALEEAAKLTEKQQLELTELILKQEKSKKVVLSPTCISYLMEHYAWVTQKMVSVSKEMDIDYLNKGKIQEPEGVALLSIVDGVDYVQYTGERISNDYLSGMPDIFLGTEIYKANTILDTKLSWDYPCFLKKLNTPVDTSNKVQIQGYLDITNASEGFVADVLVDMPETIINDYRRRLMYKMNVVTDQAPEYLAAVKEMERSMYFVNIPRHMRVFKKKVEPFDNFYRQKVYDKVKVCRDWLNNFHEMYIKLNK